MRLTVTTNYRVAFFIFYLLILSLNLSVNYVNFPFLQSEKVNIERITTVLVFSIFLFDVVKNYKISLFKLYSLFIFFIFVLYKLVFGDEFSINYTAISFVLLCLLVKEKDERFIIFISKFKFIFIFFIIFLSYIKVIPSIDIIKQNKDVLSSLGFLHTNGLGIMALGALIDLALINEYRNKVYTLNILFALAFSIVIFFLSGSRTSFILSILVVGVMLCHSFLNKIEVNSFIKLLIFIIILSLGFSPFFYIEDNDIWSRLNEVFNQRLFLGNLYLNTFGINMFPVEVYQLFLEREYDVLPYFNDNTYIAQLISSGWLFTILFNFMILGVFLKYKYSLYYFSLLSIVLLSMIVESSGYNIFLFSVFHFLYFRKK